MSTPCDNTIVTVLPIALWDCHFASWIIKELILDAVSIDDSWAEYAVRYLCVIIILHNPLISREIRLYNAWIKARSKSSNIV